MNELATALPGLLKEWRNSQETIHHLLGWCCGVLAITALATSQRPSQVVSGLLSRLWTPNAAESFDHGVHLVMADVDPRVGWVLTAWAVAIMLVRPFITARQHGVSVELAAQGLLGARAASTTWILIMLAVQFGGREAPRSWVVTVLTPWTGAVGVLVGGALFLSACRRWFRTTSDTVGHTAVLLVTSWCAVVLMVVISLAAVVMKPLVARVPWCMETESDVFQTAMANVDRTLDALPTGAVQHHSSIRRHPGDWQPTGGY